MLSDKSKRVTIATRVIAAHTIAVTFLSLLKNFKCSTVNIVQFKLNWEYKPSLDCSNAIICHGSSIYPLAPPRFDIYARAKLMKLRMRSSYSSLGPAL